MVSLRRGWYDGQGKADDDFRMPQQRNILALNLTALRQNWRFASLVASACARQAWGLARQPFLLVRQWLGATPRRLLIAPQDIRTADATVAEDIYAGHFAFSGRMVNTHGASPFEIEPPSPGWARALAGFGWLRHLRAANTALARANAQALVNDFIKGPRDEHDCADEPRVLARRLLSWLSQSPIILENADRAFYLRFIRSTGAARARLLRQYSASLSDDARLLAAIALADFALCAQVSVAAQKRATGRLSRELSIQILADGGHISRNPRLVVDLLLDLLPLRQAYAARSILAPQPLLNSIDRMIPMLRLFRHGDGTLALFNGMGFTAPDLVGTVLAYDDAQAQPIANARQSGYQRLEAGGSLLIADMGAPPPPVFSGEAHAGCLAFEFSSGDQRIIVNCGAPDPQRLEARQMARATAAHSTLVIADTSSCHVATSGGLEGLLAGQIISGPNRVTLSRGTDENGTWIEAGHDGYVARFNLVHTRRLALSADGATLFGQDHLVQAAKTADPAALAFALRFHLHPNVRAEPAEAAGTVNLVLGNGDVWQFAAARTGVTIEESIFFAAAHGARPCQQIVLQGFAEGEALANWSLVRLKTGL